MKEWRRTRRRRRRSGTHMRSFRNVLNRPIGTLGAFGCHRTLPNDAGLPVAPQCVFLANVECSVPVSELSFAQTETIDTGKAFG